MLKAIFILLGIYPNPLDEVAAIYNNRAGQEVIPFRSYCWQLACCCCSHQIPATTLTRDVRCAVGRHESGRCTDGSN